MTQHKIALVSAFPPSQNSLNEYGYHLALSFAERPDVSEVIIIADQQSAPTPELDLGPKITVQRIWRFNSCNAALDIRKAVKAAKPSLTLFNLQMASFGDWELPAALGLFAPMLTRYSGHLTGIIAHNLFLGVDLEQTNMKGKPLRQMAAKMGGAMMTNNLLKSHYMTVTLGSYAEALAQSHPMADVHLVPHGTFDKPRALKPYDKRPENIVTMGKFGTYKKLGTLIKAFCTLKPIASLEGPQLIIGGTDHPATKGYVAGLQADYAHRPDIEFWGYVAEDDVPTLFGDARLCVFDYESTTGSSGVLHQAASFGTPPIFPRIGDFVDLCDDEGLSGLHYEPGDVAGMADAMRTILSQPKMAADMATKNLEAAHAFPIAKVIDFHMEQIKQHNKQENKLSASPHLEPAE